MQETPACAVVEAKLVAMPRVVDDLQAVDHALAASEAGVLTLAPEYQWLDPVVSRFGGDTDAYLAWLTALRDERKRRPATTDTTEMRQFVRSVYQRHTMRARRNRLAKARAIAAMREWRNIDGAARAEFEARLIAAWINQRDEWVASVTQGRRLPYKERIELYSEFWHKLDEKLDSALAAANNQ